MRKLKTSQLHVIILIFSLMPFILGMTYSILKSEEKSYLSAAINIAGSERMRTMLIANYSQQLVYKADQRDEVLAILNDEIDRYLVFSNALAYGDMTIGLKANPFEDIKFTAILAKEKANELAFNVRELIQNPQDHNRLTYITENALAIKDSFHDLTERYQEQNDALIKRQMTIDASMIALGIIITIIGLTYTSKIKNQEHYSQYDFLTELNNRHSFSEFMRNHPHDQYTVFFIDLNKFKPVNDCFGHEVGDQVLVSVSRILRDIFGESHIFRYGGDEFVGLIKIDDRYKVDSKLRNLGSNPTDGKIYHIISTIRM
ncbi:diguanylate cyclase, partial [Patescibacteria group bacterium]|nr:diguanylate cyclase [Patescibacteria group bacterium]